MFQVQHYILVVQAQDAGHPTLSSTLTVYCNVLDLNDNAPLFDPMSYSNEIFENISIATPVVTVSATDLDSGKKKVKSNNSYIHTFNTKLCKVPSLYGEPQHAQATLERKINICFKQLTNLCENILYLC